MKVGSTCSASSPSILRDTGRSEAIFETTFQVARCVFALRCGDRNLSKL
jgi:hypothetical protein